jgi:hypothetical protein
MNILKEICLYSAVKKFSVIEPNRKEFNKFYFFKFIIAVRSSCCDYLPWVPENLAA